VLFACVLSCLKLVIGNKGTGWIKQLNCTECGVPYVDDVHKQLNVFHCMYSEMCCTLKTSKREGVLKLHKIVAVLVPFTCMRF
jgi:hypothetical protein